MGLVLSKSTRYKLVLMETRKYVYENMCVYVVSVYSVYNQLLLVIHTSVLIGAIILTTLYVG